MHWMDTKSDVPRSTWAELAFVPSTGELLVAVKVLFRADQVMLKRVVAQPSEIPANVGISGE